MIQKPAAQGNYKTGRRNPISRITFHHIVGSAESAITKFQTPGVQVSATYVIGSDGAIYQCVREEDTPFTDANADSNSRSITIEHAGPPYTEAMYNASVALVADLIDRYGITDFKRHRDVSDKPTACPGNLDVEWIIKQAKEKDMLDAPHQAALFVAFLGRLPEEEEVDRDVGKKTTEAMINELDQSPEYADKKKRDQQAYTTAAQVNVKPYAGPQLFVEKEQ